MCTSMPEPTIAFSCDDVSPKTKVAKLKGLLKMADRYDVDVTFFAIPKSGAKWNSCNSIVKVLKDARSCGHEIGLHGLNHFPFEMGNQFNTLSFGHTLIKDTVLKGIKILNEKLETNPRGFRAPYHHYSQNLFRVLNNLNFLYDSSKIALTNALLSYVPLVRAISISRKRHFILSRIFHPLNLKLWEIPITYEYTWYNLKFEVSLFEAFLKNNIPKIEKGCLVINSHIGALSTWSLCILKELFLHIKEAGLGNLTLQGMAERYTSMETAKAYYV